MRHASFLKKEVRIFAAHFSESIIFKENTAMGVTKLLRKSKRNVMVPQNKQELMKQRLWKPEIKKIDVEAIKAEFAAKA
ncbi:MAG: hypothetical protein ACK4GN_11650 [Runella sp.]